MEQTADDGTAVAITGIIPEDVTLNVTVKDVEDIDTEAAGIPAVDNLIAAYDITPTNEDGSAWQPEDGESIIVSIDVNALGLKEGQMVTVLHSHDGTVENLGKYAVNDGKLTFVMGNFSDVLLADGEYLAAGDDGCPYCEKIVAENGTMIHADDCEYAYDGAADVDKYAMLIPEMAEYGVEIANNHDDENSLLFYYDEFGENTIMRITDWYWDPGTTGIWYCVELISGSFPSPAETDEWDWPETPWILQCYTETDEDYPACLELFDELPVVPDVPGDVIEPHYCAICGKDDCTVAHLYCDVCEMFDCGQTHTQESTPKPPTTSVIPQNPELTEGADVSIVDAAGKAITAETGIRLYEGQKTSFSAFSDLANASYQWQICYDAKNNLWTDIQNQTGQGILISPAMVNSIIEATGSATIRCKVTSGATVEYSSPIPVTVESGESMSAERFKFARTANRAAAYALASDSETPDLGQYSVVINYVFADGTIVAAPYTASLAAGSNFTATVTHPSVMGYEPYVDNDTTSSTQIDLAITDIQADVTYTVTYKPALVYYTVIHYQQNVDNDNYTEHERETLQGLTKSTVGEVANDYPGFYALLYEHPTIAADGSTVVEIYYDRNYYLINFDLGGGYGVEPIYDRFGAPIGDVGTPTKAGYTFTGWVGTNDTAVDIPATVPAENATYTALWQMEGTAKVKVVFWGENPNDEEYSYLTTGELYLEPGEKYTYADGDTVFLICGKEEHTHGVDCSFTCGQTEHTEHTEDCLGNCTHECELSCYSAGYYSLVETTKPSQIGEVTREGIYTYTTSGWFGSETLHYYLYLDGKWYCAASGDWGSGGDDTEIEYVCDHTHTADCYTCEYHEHTVSCYSCGKEEHTHNNSCNRTGSGLDSSLWTFVRSENVIVAADGSTVVNVYYDRTTFTMTFKETGRNGNTLDTITDKWGADIREDFGVISSANTYLWSMDSDGGSPWTSFMDVMPAEDRTYYAKTTNSNNVQTATYLVQKIGTEAGNTANYEVLYTVNVKYGSNLTVSAEEFVDIEGYTFNDSLSTNTGSSYDGAKFYYDRHDYAIEFYNPTTLLRKTENVPYESPLSSYNWTPAASDAPAQYEPGSVTFEGWYLNPECTGDKFDFATHTMPAGTNDGDTTLTLYAKWVPSGPYTVSFYLNLDALAANEKLSTHPDTQVYHGQKLESVPAIPVNGEYKFVGWFYKDGNVEKAFDFANMPIKKDMQFYGKWSSDVLKEYFVYFKLQNTDTDIDIAEPITGSALAGTTKTFDAKGGTELYDRYQEGYFPLVKSHSITLDANDDEKNKCTFWYVKAEKVPYTVYYVTESQDDKNLSAVELDGQTYYILAETKTVDDNRQAVVTERFVPVSGYMPDAYQKRLVVDGTDGADNKIIFIYSKDTENAYYKITHYIENLELDSNGNKTWTEYKESQAHGKIGDTITAEHLTNIDGFTYDYTVDGTVASGKLTTDGLELKLYYTRNSYPYEVRYLEYGTGKVLAVPKSGTAKYGAVISETAIDIANYTVVGDQTQTCTIKIETGETVQLNVITFYYELAKVDLTITKTVTGVNSPADIDQDFIFTVTGVGVNMQVVIPASEFAQKQSFTASVTIKGLPAGKTYTVTENTNWSWRYTSSDSNQSITLTANGENKVPFTNTRDKFKWLDGTAIMPNRFSVKTVSEN